MEPRNRRLLLLLLFLLLAYGALLGITLPLTVNNGLTTTTTGTKTTTTGTTSTTTGTTSTTTGTTSTTTGTTSTTTDITSTTTTDTTSTTTTTTPAPIFCNCTEIQDLSFINPVTQNTMDPVGSIQSGAFISLNPQGNLMAFTDFFFPQNILHLWNMNTNALQYPGFIPAGPWISIDAPFTNPYVDSAGVLYGFLNVMNPTSTFGLVKLDPTGNLDTSYGTSGYASLSLGTGFAGAFGDPLPIRAFGINDPTSTTTAFYSEIDVVSGTFFLSPQVITTPYPPLSIITYWITAVQIGVPAGYSIFTGDFSYGCSVGSNTFFSGVSYCIVTSLQVDSATNDVYAGGYYSSDGGTTFIGFVLKFLGGVTLDWTAIISLGVGETSVNVDDILLTPANCLYVTGGYNAGGNGGFLIKIDTQTGNQIANVLSAPGPSWPFLAYSNAIYVGDQDSVRKYTC